MSYEAALARTDPRIHGTVAKGSKEEGEAIARFRDFIAVLSPEMVRAKTRRVYAEQAYFNDTLKEAQGIDAIEAYLTKSLEGVERVTVEVRDVAESEGNYYFAWTMHIAFKNLKKGQVCTSVGMSHIRFDREGKVVLHQDYWDAAGGLFAHIPILGQLIGWVKSRL